MHLFIVFLLWVEAEETWIVLLVTSGPAFASGMFAEMGRRPIWEAAFAAAWFPAWMTWSKWYWTIGMPSPGGAGAKLAEIATGAQGAGTAGVFGTMAFCGVAGWLLAGYDRIHKRRYGKSMFEEE